MKAICILGNQLFERRLLPLKSGETCVVFMREDRDLCTHFRYHKHKIIFFLAAMRTYASELTAAGIRVHYETLSDDDTPFEERLVRFLKKENLESVEMFEIEDKFFESRIENALNQAEIRLQTHKSPMFLTTRQEFSAYNSSVKKPFMKTFYESQRKRLQILVEEDGSPTGGQWSFDEDNRKPLPKDHRCPRLPEFKPSAIELEVMKLVEDEFPLHPGSSADFWLPCSRQGARAWARDFFDKRFRAFGPYEDALSSQEDFVYHSVLTPYLNTGLLTPRECVLAALKAAKENNIPIASLEGFIRQVIGWREFVRGIYQNYSDTQETGNHFGHKRKLTNAWYEGHTGIPPLDGVIRKTIRYSYAHHIERLMVVGSLMLLLEVDPHEAHRWFMEMFIDSSDWVMGPNVYGMALFSDGGIFATKPYICGSNYYLKMSDYKRGEWCDAVDGLYWGFIHKNKAAFAKNPRMSMMARSVEKLDPKKFAKISQAADVLRERLTTL